MQFNFHYSSQGSSDSLLSLESIGETRSGKNNNGKSATQVVSFRINITSKSKEENWTEKNSF